MTHDKSPQIMWVLDLEGYDARGGNAEVFSSLDAAKAAAGSDKEWSVSECYGRIEYTETGCGYGDALTIYPVILDKREPSEDDWPEDMRREAEAVRAETERRNAEVREKWKREHPLQRTSNGWARRGA